MAKGFMIICNNCNKAITLKENFDQNKRNKKAWINIIPGACDYAYIKCECGNEIEITNY